MLEGLCCQLLLETFLTPRVRYAFAAAAQRLPCQLPSRLVSRHAVLHVCKGSHVQQGYHYKHLCLTRSILLDTGCEGSVRVQAGPLCKVCLQVRTAIVGMLDAWITAVPLEKVLPAVADAIAAPKASSEGKLTGLKWLSAILDNGRASKGLAHVLRAATLGMNDKASDVREAGSAVMNLVLEVSVQQMMHAASLHTCGSLTQAPNQQADNHVRNLSRESACLSDSPLASCRLCCNSIHTARFPVRKGWMCTASCTLINFLVKVNVQLRQLD